jgi:hypothetical protein
MTARYDKPARVAKVVDAADSKSAGAYAPCEFESRPGHQTIRRWRDIPDDEVARAVADHRFAVEVLRHFGFHPPGNSYGALARRVRRLGLDTRHWLPYRPPPRPPLRRPLEDALTVGGYAPETNRAKIKGRLIREGILKNECRVCGLGPSWQGRELVLRLDHVNGDRNDWRRENLALICPNCDSQQPTFAGRNASRRRATLVGG